MDWNGCFESGACVSRAEYPDTVLWKKVAMETVHVRREKGGQAIPESLVYKAMQQGAWSTVQLYVYSYGTGLFANTTTTDMNR